MPNRLAHSKVGRLTAVGNQEEIAPETYQRHQRLSILANRLKSALKIQDLLEGDSLILSLDLGDGLLENWMMVPDNRHIAIAYYLGAGGFESTFGRCVYADTGITAYEFEVSNTANSLPLLYSSAEHKIMISNHWRDFDVYDLETGVRLRHISQYDKKPYWLFGKSVTVNPHDKWQFAMDYRDAYGSLVVIFNIAEPSSEGKIIKALKQADQIDDIEFFPDGVHIAALLRSGGICVWDTVTEHLIATLSRGT